jgi:RNA polymerase sigma-70 factor (ECF subfamily)
MGSVAGGALPPDPLEARLVEELPRLRSFVRGLAVRSAADADDLVQEVATRALRYRRAFDPSRALGPWLRRTAVRAWLDHRKRERERPATLEGAEGQVPARNEGEVGEREELERLLSRLAPIERDVLLRFHQDGQSVREIAAALGMPEGTVKSHLHRARRKLAAGADEDAA